MSINVIFVFRLVLSSCSPFLRDAFLTPPQGLPEFTLMLPTSTKRAVSTMIDFIYTVKTNNFLRSASND